jgi:hypothetical protein
MVLIVASAIVEDSSVENGGPPKTQRLEDAVLAASVTAIAPASAFIFGVVSRRKLQRQIAVCPQSASGGGVSEAAVADKATGVWTTRLLYGFALASLLSAAGETLITQLQDLRAFCLCLGPLTAVIAVSAASFAALIHRTKRFVLPLLPAELAPSIRIDTDNYVPSSLSLALAPL